MEFLSPEVQACFLLFRQAGFAQARARLLSLSQSPPEPITQLEAACLMARIDGECVDKAALPGLRVSLRELFSRTRESGGAAALYHLGITSLLCEVHDLAREIFELFLHRASTPDERARARYGLAAVLYVRRENRAALDLIDELIRDDLGPDLKCMALLLKGNCLLEQDSIDAALTANLAAQAELPFVKSPSLRNWVVFGLGLLYARYGEIIAARALFELVLNITSSVEFRRLHELARAELERLEARLEILFDPVSGEVVSRQGRLCLRRKPTLIAILSELAECWPNPVSKERLHNRVWCSGEYHPLRHDGLIYSHMQRLRHLLASDKELADFIQTVPEGYRINGKFHIQIVKNRYA